MSDPVGERPQRRRLAFFDYPDVFEDFYPHYGITEKEFCHSWAATGNHALVSMLQRYVGDVTWYVQHLSRQESGPHVHDDGFTVRVLPSSLMHRTLWNAYYLGPHGWRFRQWDRSFATAATYLAPLSRQFLRAVCDDKPDVIVLQDYANGKFDLAVASAALHRRPVVAYHSGSFAAGYLARWPKRLTMPRADLLLVAAAAERQRLTADFRVAPRKIRSLLTPIDTERFAPGRVEGPRSYFLFMGRLDDRVKRVSAIIRAFRASGVSESGLGLVIAGDGPDGPRLRKVAGDPAATGIRFSGWVDDDESKAALYSGAIALVLASRSEGFPTVVGEALACGTPVIATDVGAVSEAVQSGSTGWLVDPGDDAGLVNAFRAAVVAERSGSIRVNARQFAERELSPGVLGPRLAMEFDALLRRDHSL